MIAQPYRVHLSIASPSEIERTARELMAVREDFLSTGSLSLWMPRPLILASWERCQTFHVNPSRRCAPLAVARETQLEQLRANNMLLIEAAHPPMSNLIDFFADSGYVVVLSDAQGRLLEVVGDPTIRRRLERIDFVPGGNWNEAAAGTNAIGTALADGHVVQLMAAEHYCDGWQDLTCTAAPIHHPFTNEIIGILDVTGDYRLIRPFLTGLLSMAALEIRHRLQSLLSLQHLEMRQRRNYSLVVTAPSSFQTTQASETTMNQTSPLRSGKYVPSDKSLARWRLTPQERRAHDAERLAAASGIISASLDLQVTLENVAEQAVHLFGTEQAGVHLFDEDEQVQSLCCSAGQPQAGVQPSTLFSALLSDTRAVSLIRERGEPVVIDDICNSPLLPLALVEQMHIRSILLLPLVTARGVIGFITVSWSIPTTWSIEEIRLGLTFATQSATALENARLFDALQQHNSHIETLNAIARILSTLPDPGQHFGLVLQRIIEITKVDAGAILLLEQQSERLMLAAYGRRGQERVMSLDELSLKTLSLFAHRVIDIREPFTLCAGECAEPAIAEALRCSGFHHVMAVALATSDTVLGVLLVGTLCCSGRNKDDLAFFATVGQQLGLALRNAQLLRAASEMEALREADRVKSGFLAAVSHDLRSPLTAIRASVESLLDADGIQSAMGKDRLLHNIAGQANRLGQLVDQLLDLSRIEAGVLALDCDWVELPILIHDAVTEFTRLYGEDCIEEIVEQDLPLAYIDANRVVQVLWNLLENAEKYATPQSSIQIVARLIDREVLLSVADSGPGIPRGEHEKVFQRFYRLDRDQRSHVKGSGLGLAICRGIVEAHGGRIWVEDREDGGCIFQVALPLPTSSLPGFDTSEAREILV